MPVEVQFGKTIANSVVEARPPGIAKHKPMQSTQQSRSLLKQFSIHGLKRTVPRQNQFSQRLPVKLDLLRLEQVARLTQPEWQQSQRLLTKLGLHSLRSQVRKHAKSVGEAWPPGIAKYNATTAAPVVVPASESALLLQRLQSAGSWQFSNGQDSTAFF